MHLVVLQVSMANRSGENRASLVGVVQGPLLRVPHSARSQVAFTGFHRWTRQRTHGWTDARCLRIDYLLELSVSIVREN